MADYGYLERELSLAAPATPTEVARLRHEFGRQVPDDYLAFVTAHDGAVGACGVLVPVAKVGRADDLYPELDQLHGLVVFGNDGGLEAFGFDANGAVVMVPWIGGPEDAIAQGSFTEFLHRWVHARLFDRGH